MFLCVWVSPWFSHTGSWCCFECCCHFLDIFACYWSPAPCQRADAGTDHLQIQDRGNYSPLIWVSVFWFSNKIISNRGKRLLQRVDLIISINRTTLSWFKSYLSDWFYELTMNSPYKTNVVQGSVRFCASTNSIHLIIKKNSFTASRFISFIN